MKNKLHLIALNIPFPPDYGGAIDIFYKIKSLHGLGLEIILHCFKYNRSQNIELNKYCTEVFYYERKNRAIDFFSSLPFIVKTRNHPQLLENILNNPAPILFDGLHTCHYLNNAKLASLTKIVRTHNIEHEYYLALTKSTNSLFHRFFFNREAKKLKNFEKVLEHANALACISPEDKSYFDNKYGNAFFIPAFHPYEKNVSLKGRGDYILFHGNLSVAENRKALDFILNEVLYVTNYRIVVAGKEPSLEIKKKIAKKENWELIENPGDIEMQRLIQQAHICFIPTFQSTGLKLKLLSSLFSGRFVITNSQMVNNTGLEQLCIIGNSAEELNSLIRQTMKKDFTQNEIEKRESVINENFSNKKVAKNLLRIITDGEK